MRTSETLLDLLDLYTHHRAATIVGQLFALETFISVRITLNLEASTHQYPRYTMTHKKSSGNHNGSANATNGVSKHSEQPATPTMTSPRDASVADLTSPVSANGASKPGLKEGTVRFMLDPQRAKDEKEAVKDFFKVEEEEYEVEVERKKP